MEIAMSLAKDIKVDLETVTDPWTEAVIIKGRQLRLEPAGLEHLDSLAKNILSPHVWHSVHWNIRSKEDLQKWVIERSIKARSEKTGIGFAMVIQATGEAVGLSHFMNLNRRHNYLEIGGTWIGEKWQRTFVNTEAKLLMLSRAFEAVGCQRVEFRVDSLNFQSQTAVQRIGAKFEGELRQIALLPDGRKRDYKVYSILDGEWTNVKKTLNWYLDRHVSS